MTQGNVRELGVRGLAVHCLNHACRHQTVISLDDYADNIEGPSFRLRMKCSKCGGRNVDAPELERAATDQKPDREAMEMTDARALAFCWTPLSPSRQPRSS
jgi:hypothetical protein